MTLNVLFTNLAKKMTSLYEKYVVLRDISKLKNVCPVPSPSMYVVWPFRFLCRSGTLLSTASEDNLNEYAYILSALESKKEKLKSKMGEQNLSLLPELYARIAVLKNLQYIDKDDTVTLKGRCCCFVLSANACVMR